MSMKHFYQTKKKTILCIITLVFVYLKFIESYHLQKQTPKIMWQKPSLLRLFVSFFFTSIHFNQHFVFSHVHLKLAK